MNAGEVAAAIARLPAARRVAVVRNELIYTPGTDDDAVYVVVSGRVKIVRTSPSGAEAIVGIRNPGDLFGELTWMRAHPVRIAGAVAIASGELLKIPARDFRDSLRAQPELAASFARLVAARLATAEMELTELAGKSVPGRLIDVLGRLAREHGVDDPGGGRRIAINLTHKDLADLIGTSRETLTKELGMLADIGLLRVAHKTVTLLQPQAFPFATRPAPPA